MNSLKLKANVKPKRKFQKLQLYLMDRMKIKVLHKMLVVELSETIHRY